MAGTVISEMKDKFKENLIFALPAAIITIVILMLIGQGNAELAPQEIDIFKVLPYITILVLAVSGLMYLLY